MALGGGAWFARARTTAEVTSLKTTGMHLQPDTDQNDFEAIQAIEMASAHADRPHQLPKDLKI